MIAFNVLNLRVSYNHLTLGPYILVHTYGILADNDVSVTVHNKFSTLLTRAYLRV